jgi:hypothetical protein
MTGYKQFRVVVWIINGGSHNISITAKDAAGNSSTTSTLNFSMVPRVSLKSGYYLDNATGQKLTTVYASDDYTAQSLGCFNLILGGISSWYLPTESQLMYFGGVGAEKIISQNYTVWTSDTTYSSGIVNGKYYSSVKYAGTYNLYSGSTGPNQTTYGDNVPLPAYYAVCFSY